MLTNISVTKTARVKEFETGIVRCVYITFFANKRKAPGENIHEVGQPIWVRTTIELANIHYIILVLQDGSLEMVNKKCHYSS